MGGVGELAELVAFGALAGGAAGGLGRGGRFVGVGGGDALEVEFGFFEDAEDGFGAFDDGAGHAGEAGDLDAVAFVGATGEDLVEEDDAVLPFTDGDIEVAEAGEPGGEFGEFVVVGGEEGAGADGVVEVFDDRPGEAESVEGAGAAPDFIEDDQAAAGGVVEDAGGLAHFDHEGGLTAGEVVAGADAGEEAVHEADAGTSGGKEGAGVGEEGEEGDLTDVGAFAGHVGAGDQGDLGGVHIEVGVVGDEGFGGAGAVEDRVAAFLDEEDAVGGDFGADVTAEAGIFGEGGEGIELGEDAGGGLEGGDAGEDLFPELLEEGVLEFEGAFLGTEDSALHFLEGGGDIAFAAGDGLFADVVGGDFVEVGAGDFEVIAEDGIEADFQGGDAGALDFLLLEAGDPVVAFASRLAEGIEFRVVTVTDEAALLEGEGRVVHQGMADEFGEVGFGGEFGEERGEEGRGVGGGTVGGRGWDEGRDGLLGNRGLGEVLDEVLEGGDLFEGEAEGDEVAGIAGAGAEAAEGSFEIADLAQGGAEGGEGFGVVQEAGYGVLAALDGFEVGEGLAEPVAEEPRAHGGGGGLEGGEEGGSARGIAVEGFEDFEVTEGGGIEVEEAGGFVGDQGGELGDIPSEVLGEVVEGGAGGGDGGGPAAEAEAIEGRDTEMFAEGEFGGFGGEGPVF